jgi:DNA modification methylase
MSNFSESSRRYSSKFVNHIIISDLFGGSGSTMIACHQLDRTCYMMELDPKYCDVIVKRYMATADKVDDIICQRGAERITPPYEWVTK